MNNYLKIANECLLAPTGITENNLEKIIGKMLGNQIDYADLYFQSNCTESFLLESSIVKQGNFNIDKGVGIRAVAGEKSGFSYSDDIIISALEDSAVAARSIAKRGGINTPKVWQDNKSSHNLYTTNNPLKSITDSEKILLLQKIDNYVRAKDSAVKEVILSLTAQHNTVLIVSSDGTFGADIRPLVKLNINVIVEKNGCREQASAGGSKRGDYNEFDDDTWQFFANEVVRKALLKLEAKPAPAGTMSVVLGPGWPGILLHEAVGHGLEGDFNRKGSSAFTGKIGQRVASPLCTIVDDGTLAGRRGSLNIDDEGTQTQCTTLIENGILKAYMQDKLNARLMKTKSTGNGRRETYAHLPMPRMTNTYMLAGKHESAEIISSIQKGILAVDFSGGSVDITSGKFVFEASEAYWVENGKIEYPVKGATLIGNGPDVLTKVSMVGNDLKLDTGIGTCGKNGQNIPVCVGQPTLRIDEITVGGTQ